MLIILTWLQKQKLAAVCTQKNQSLVKLSKNEIKSVEISDIDIGIYNLENQQEVLKNYISKLENERNAALEKTKSYLSSKMKNMVTKI